MGPQFFDSIDGLRAWFVEHHTTEPELIVGFWRKETGRQTYSWSEAVDQALCFGWIDGVRRRIDDQSFSNRFTPRRPGSNWSDINLAKVEALSAAGLMYPAGIAAHANRIVRSAAYSFEQPADLALDPLQIKQFQRNKAAWDFFESRSASYRKRVVWWVVSAKRAETRAQRLAKLVALCAENKTM